MGYRYYFFKADIAKCDIVENMTYDEFKKHCENEDPNAEDFFNYHNALGQTEIFEFGKLYWDDTVESIYALGRPLFNVEETQEKYNYYEPYRMGKEGLLKAIKIHEAKVIKYYESLLVDDAEHEGLTSSAKQKMHVDDILFWWKEWGVVDLEESNEEICRSWLFEHQIFELVRLYKSIDWEKHCLLFYGY